MTPHPRTPSRRPAAGDLKALLSHTSTTSERVRGLIDLGLPASQIARTCGVSVSGLRNWANGSSQPRPDAAITLDDLRAVAYLLLEQMAAERVVSWLMSRDPETRRRPLDEIAAMPTEVLAAALEDALEAKLANDERDEDALVQS